mgnify:CR=1 FL=1
MNEVVGTKYCPVSPVVIDNEFCVSISKITLSMNLASGQ